MKLVIALVVATLCLASMPSCARAAGEEAILNFLEEFRARMCHPIPKWNLPALDPLELPDGETYIDNQYLVDFTGSIKNFRLTGLSDFIVNQLEIPGRPALPIIVNVTLPFTELKTLYTAYGSLAYIFRFAGNGEGEASLEELTLAISFNINVVGKLRISNLKIDLSLASIFISFETLLEEPRLNDFFHALINELGVELLHDIWVWGQESVQDFVEGKVNEVLGQYTLSELLEIIGSGGEGSDEPIFGPNDPPGDCKTTPAREIHPLLRLKQKQQQQILI